MKEHREPPRIAPIDGQLDSATERVGGRFRLRRFDEAGNHRKIAYNRAGLLAVAGLALAVGLLYFTYRSGLAAVAWLASQRQYQIPFEKIQLVNSAGQSQEPPAWYRGGSRAFLENVRLASREPEDVSLLTVTRDQLSLAFGKYAWVQDVVRVTYPPGGIRVELRYRQPVAWVQLRGGDQILVDDEGTILPTKDVDVAPLGLVIKISGDAKGGDLAPPSDLRYGVKWKTRVDEGGQDRVDERILAAAKLAHFFVERAETAGSKDISSLRLHSIIVATDFARRGLFAMNADGSAIRWGDAPGAERPETPSAAEKWAMLRRWAETTEDRCLDSGDFWAFSKNGVQFVCGHRNASHRPKPCSDRQSGPVGVTTKSRISGKLPPIVSR